MAVNSWLITIKRRIKLPLVPPGGSAAISTLEHYCATTGAGWLAASPQHHHTLAHLSPLTWLSANILTYYSQHGPTLSRYKQKLDYDEI